jgi:hypothetical protein
MSNKPAKVIPFTPLTLSDVLERYEEALKQHDLIIGLSDGNVRITKKQAGRHYEVQCNENDVTLPSTLHTFLER